ncbi:MAG: NADH-quinone oxidoreductase subunit J [Actinobacteria bacterium]|nr:NADH-quinone oxidoreductase subunit J [Actinomycetota bacterium]
MEWVVFVLGALICALGAFGVVTRSNPVHAALSLIGTFFGIAVLFIAQDAEFLAAVQVIVYAGSIVVLFLFVIMLLGVDTAEDLEVEPITGQRTAAVVAGVAIAAVLIFVVVAGAITGATSSAAPIDTDVANPVQIGRVLFTDYLWAFEITSILLVIAVVGAVTLARHRPDGMVDDELVDELPAPAVVAVDEGEVAT